MRARTADKWGVTILPDQAEAAASRPRKRPTVRTYLTLAVLAVWGVGEAAQGHLLTGGALLFVAASSAFVRLAWDGRPTPVLPWTLYRDGGVFLSLALLAGYMGLMAYRTVHFLTPGPHFEPLMVVLTGGGLLVGAAAAGVLLYYRYGPPARRSGIYTSSERAPSAGS